MSEFSFDEILRPHIDAAVFLDLFGRRAGTIGKNVDWASEIFRWQDLDDILTTNRLCPPRLRISNGVSGSPEFVRLRHGRRGSGIPRLELDQLYSALRDGGTLILDAIDELHSPLRELTRAFARTFGSIPQTNLYASFGSTPGFGMHWDDHDVFIVQIYGFKHWKIYHPTRQNPMYKDLEAPPTPSENSEPYFDDTIDPGTILYVPRGHWHDVLGKDSPSLHLTIGVTHPTPSDVLIWLSDQIKTSSNLRRDIPMFQKKERRKLEQELLAFISEFGEEALFDKYLKHRRKSLVYRAEPSILPALTRQFSGEETFHWLSLDAPVLLDSGDVEVTYAGKSAIMDRRCFDVLIYMFDKKRGLIKDLLPTENDLSPSQVAAIMLALVDMGAISIRDR